MKNAQHLTNALALVAAQTPRAIFSGKAADGFQFSARADLYLIRHAWESGVNFEKEANGFGGGMGTMGGDWSGIRDSSEPQTEIMLRKAVAWFANNN